MMKLRLVIACLFALSLQALGQTLNSAPPQRLIMLSSDGGVTFNPFTGVSGFLSTNSAPLAIVPMCSATGSPPYSQCTFGTGTGTVTTTGTPAAGQLTMFSGATSITTATAHAVSNALLCADTSASGTVQVCNTSPTYTPAAGDWIIYTTTTANTGTALTLNVNSLGAKPVAKWQATTTLAANDVLANKYVLATYDGTNWELSTIGNPPSGAAAFQYSALPNPPALAGFTWVNQQGSGGTLSTATQTGGAGNAIDLNFFSLGTTLQWQFQKIATPAAPWRAKCFVAVTEQGNTSTNAGAVANTSAGGCYVTDGTKYMGIENLMQASSTLSTTSQTRVEKITNVSTDGSTVWGSSLVTPFSLKSGSGIYEAWCYDGTNTWAEFSLNGVNWYQVFEDAAHSYLTPSAVAFGGIAATGATGPNLIVSLQGWQIDTTGVTCP